MAMRRACERDERIHVTQAMLDAYNGSGKQRNKLLTLFAAHKGDLEKISMEIMQDILA